MTWNLRKGTKEMGSIITGQGVCKGVCFLAMCVAEISSLNFAATKYRQHMRPNCYGVPTGACVYDMHYSFIITADLYSHSFPQTAAASTMGRSSFTVML